MYDNSSSCPRLAALPCSFGQPIPSAAQPKPDTAGPPDAAAPQSELKVVQQVNASIDRGLEYMAAKQRKDGGWHTNNAINSLAMLAPSWAAGIRRAAAAIRTCWRRARSSSWPTPMDNPKGYLAQLGGGSMYEHGLTTLSLAEMYGMDPDPELEARLRAAVALIEKTQSPRGGWRYGPSPDNQDLSVTVMQIVALRAANNAEIPVLAEGDRQRDRLREVVQLPGRRLRL